MTTTEIFATIERNNEYLEMLEGNPEAERIVAALNAQNGELRAQAAAQGVFIL